MKKFTGLSIMFVFLFAVAFFTSASSGIYSEKEVGGKVLSIHQLNLKEGVNVADFEAFILNELLPYYNEVKGQKGDLAKGDRGIRTGKYAIILSFDSLADRNRIYPPEGGISDDFEEILKGTEELWDKLGSFVEGDAFGNHTDYVTILP